jgi:hypothetical protein
MITVRTFFFYVTKIDKSDTIAGDDSCLYRQSLMDDQI